MIQGLMCDIDGTLVHSNWLHAEAWRVAFAAMDVDLDVETLRRQIGKGGDELIPEFVPWWKRDAVSKPLKKYREFVLETQFLHQITPLPRVREFLTCVKEAGIRVGLATSASEKDLKFYKKLANIEDLVEAETSADDAKHAKPYPDIFEAALDRLGLNPQDAMALGDTPYDAEAAGKAGVRTIGVMTGGWSREDLLHAGCIAVYKDVGELLDGFKDSPLVW